MISRREYARAYYHKNSEKIIARHVAWRAALPAETKSALNRKEYERRLTDPKWVARNQQQDKLEATRLRARNGFTPELIEKCLQRQNHACAICRKRFVDSKKMHADHCHDTNTPRGLLCFQCNIIEGKLRKMGLDPLVFGERLRDYLAKPPASQE